MATLIELPLDVLLLLIPYLEPADFLNLCGTCRTLTDPAVRYDHGYWKHKTQEKFRIPNRPADPTDGQRWQQLYKRLRTQSRVYTWGENKQFCLGRPESQPVTRPGPPIRGRYGFRGVPRTFGHAGRIATTGTNSLPGEMDKTRELGVIADLQCGGWSTSLLTDRGTIHTVGVQNEMYGQRTGPGLHELSFPASASAPGDNTAIKQFSSGRYHILGLADDGAVWHWHNHAAPSKRVHHTEFGDASVTKVIAGWDSSSAYFRGHGIVYWDPETNIDQSEQSYGEDDLHIFDWIVVPKTGYRRPKRQNARVAVDDATADLRDNVGEVTNYIVLEGWIVFVTDIKKVFAFSATSDFDQGVVYDIFELEELRDARDVQGTFRTFGVIKNNGEVLIANSDYLNACLRKAFQNGEDQLPSLTVIPALQHTGVVQLAFGDYHYHALHSDGSITSYGREPSHCGALGLGSNTEAQLRGMNPNPNFFGNFDAGLLPHTYVRGRKIWFQREKSEWARHLADGGKDSEEASERISRFGDTPTVQAEVSEWVEQMGSDWDKRTAAKEADEDGLGAHFALSVAAAGWHSGALVLGNDRVVDAVSRSCLVKETAEEPESSASGGQTEVVANAQGSSSMPNKTDIATEGDDGHLQLPEGYRWAWSEDHFPRLRLSDGTEMPGNVTISEWKEAKPEWKLRHTGSNEDKAYGVPQWKIEE